MFFIHGVLHTMAGPVLEDGFFEIQDGKIAKVGPMSQLTGIPSGAVDLKGAVVTPGFIDAHCHIGIEEDSIGPMGSDCNEMTDPSTPHLRVIDAVNPRERCYSEAVDAGVTTVVTCPGSANPIGGTILAMKTVGSRVDDMAILENAGIKFALGENPKRVYQGKKQLPSTRMGTAAVIREQLIKAQKYLEKKEAAAADSSKSEPEFNMKCEALIPLLKREVKAHFHCHRADDIYTAIRLGREFSLDYILVHCTEGHLIAEDIAKEGVPAICGPLLTTRSKPELSNSTQANPGALSKAGVLTAICTDHDVIPMPLLPTSAGFAVGAGMDYEEALRAITINPAKICKLDGRVGSLEEGKDADILVFDGDPLAVANKPKMVFVNGIQVK